MVTHEGGGLAHWERVVVRRGESFQRDGGRWWRWQGDGRKTDFDRGRAFQPLGVVCGDDREIGHPDAQVGQGGGSLIAYVHTLCVNPGGRAVIDFVPDQFRLGVGIPDQVDRWRRRRKITSGGWNDQREPE